jgi:hypothetical protein
MGLDYSQKRLLNIASHKRAGKRATLSSMKRRRQLFGGHLEIYAFWTGFASTMVSLVQVIIIAFKK